MRARAASSLLIVMAILIIMAVVSEVFVDDFLRPSSLFGYLLVSTMATGILATAIVEKIDARILG